MAKKTFDTAKVETGTWHVDLSGISKDLLANCKIKVWLAESGTSTVYVSSIKAYTNGVKDDNEIYLYSYGSEYETVTGGWETFNYGSATSQKQSDCFYIGSNDQYSLGGFVTAIKVDVSRYTTCDVTFQPDVYYSSSAPFTLCFGHSKVAISSAPQDNNFEALHSRQMENANKNTFSYDISTLNGELYIIICLRVHYSKIFEIKLR